MKTLREVLNELEVIAKVSGKSKLTESAAQATVQYITKMKEAFGDMENGVEADEEMPADKESEEVEEQKTVEERLVELEEKVAALEAEKEGHKPETDKENPFA